MSDGFSDVSEELHYRDGETFEGCCFYHGQDLERAVDGGGLMFAFSDFEDNKDNTRLVGEKIKACLETHGFAVEWDGDVNNRISVPKIL